MTLFEKNNFSMLGEQKDENVDVKKTILFCVMEFC